MTTTPTKTPAKYRIGAGQMALRRVEASEPIQPVTQARRRYGYEIWMCRVTFGADSNKLGEFWSTSVFGMPHVYVWTPILRMTSGMGLTKELRDLSWAAMAYGIQLRLHIRVQIGFGLTDY